MSDTSLSPAGRAPRSHSAGVYGAEAPLSSQRSLWITWHDHQRTRSIAERLGVEVAVRDVPNPLDRHFIGSFWAVGRLVGSKPTVVYLHFSYALMLVCALYKLVARRSHVRIVCDCHNKALMKRFAHGDAAFQFFKRRLLAVADVLVVTNNMVASYAGKIARQVVILRDPLPVIPEVPGPASDGGAAVSGAILPASPVVFVCSFDSDEPLSAIYGAALRITAGGMSDVVITGNFRKVELPDELVAADNIVTPGFLPRDDYVRLIRSAAALVVLTNDQDCLLCGAYEAIAVRRPLVLSDTPILRACFGRAAEYAPNDPEGIYNAVSKVLEQGASDGHSGAIGEFEKAFAVEWACFKSAVAHDFP